jgi:general secretion pathway protein F
MRFNLKVYRQADGILPLAIDAADDVSARRQAEALGYTVLSVRSANALLNLPWARREKFAAPLFCQQLLALLEAGLGLVEAIDLLCRKSRQAETREVLAELVRRMREGATFSKSLDGMATRFPPLFIATVRASERTGDLPEALRRYLDYERKVNVLRDKVVAASVYPLVLMGVGGLVVMFLLTYVVPRFSKVYEDVGQDRLPFLSRMLMGWGQAVSEHLFLIGLGFASVLGLCVWLLTRPATRAAIERRLWKVAAIGEYLRTYQLARFTRTIAMLLKGGIPLLSALQMADDLLQQPALREGLARARKAIGEGRSVSECFNEQGLATDVGVRLLVVGERSGELGMAMERIAAFYDDEIGRAVEWFSRLFEPILMLVIGFMIGGIVILMYLPIFELASAVQ